MDNRTIWQSLPGPADFLAAAEDRANRISAANFSCHTMQPKRRFIRVGDLADAVRRSRDDIPFAQLILRKCSGMRLNIRPFEKPHRLRVHADGKNKATWQKLLVFERANQRPG